MPSDTTQMESEYILSALMNLPLSRSVEATSALLKRWYILERSCMRALAGWLPGVETQEIKLLLARHLYMDAQAADALRERILQLRYPRRDVDRGWDARLVALLQSATNAPDERCCIAGFYRVLKTALLAAYRQAALQCEPVGDSPTLLVLDPIIAAKQRQMDEMLPALTALEQRTPEGAERQAHWERYLQTLLEACGGVSGAEAGRELPVDRTLERPFERPTEARRDPRYQRRCILMTYPGLYWIPDDPSLLWLCHARGHFDELWAAEAASELIYSHPDAPWNLLLDGARWCFDESRHCRMGMARLERAGVDLFADIPPPDTITYDCFEPDHLQERLFAIHCFERGAIVGGAKQAGMHLHRQMGDGQGDVHYDFDWADESIHLQYGLEWIKHLYGEEILDEQFDSRLAKAVTVRTTRIMQLAKQEEPLVESNYRHLCARIGIPFKIKPTERPASWDGDMDRKGA